MSPTRFLIVFATALVLFASALSCQSGTPETPPKSATPSPENNLPTPSDELPKIPKKATKETKQGAIAFGRYYYELINYGRATGDWKPAKDVTESSCKPCRQFWADEPRRMDNGLSIRFRRDPFVARFDDSRKIVVFDVSSDKDVTDTTRKPLNEWADQLRLEYVGSKWTVVDLKIKDLSKPPQGGR